VAKDPDTPVAGLLNGGPGSWKHHADHGRVEVRLELGKGGGTGGVAGHYDQFHSLPYKESSRSKSQPTHLDQRLRPVRESTRVAEVDEVLVRQVHQAFMEDGESPDARIEDAHRPPIRAVDRVRTIGFVNVANWWVLSRVLAGVGHRRPILADPPRHRPQDTCTNSSGSPCSTARQDAFR